VLAAKLRFAKTLDQIAKRKLGTLKVDGSCKCSARSSEHRDEARLLRQALSWLQRLVIGVQDLTLNAHLIAACDRYSLVSYGPEDRAHQQVGFALHMVVAPAPVPKAVPSRREMDECQIRKEPVPSHVAVLDDARQSGDSLLGGSGSPVLWPEYGNGPNDSDEVTHVTKES
jgi:hypothetical protein